VQKDTFAFCPSKKIRHKEKERKPTPFGDY
jgi:hypothetical protein